MERWRAVTEAIPQPDRPMAEFAADFVRANNRHRNFARLLAWEGLEYAPATGEEAAVGEQEIGREELLRRTIDDICRRQDLGELPADVSPDYLLLALFALSSAPVVLPHVVKRILGTDPDSEECEEEYARQVERIIRGLAVPAPPQ